MMIGDWRCNTAEQKEKPFLTEEEWEEAQRFGRIIGNLIDITQNYKAIVTTIQTMSEVSEPELVKMGAVELHNRIDKLEKGLLEAIELRKEEQDV